MWTTILNGIWWYIGLQGIVLCIPTFGYLFMIVIKWFLNKHSLVWGNCNKMLVTLNLYACNISGKQNMIIYSAVEMCNIWKLILKYFYFNCCTHYVWLCLVFTHCSSFYKNLIIYKKRIKDKTCCISTYLNLLHTN